MRGDALTLRLVFVGNMRQQRSYLPIALARAVAVGAVAGIADIARGTVHIATQHQFVGQFPHRTLVHRGIADISQHRLRQPVHHLGAVALQLVFDVTGEGHKGVGMTAWLHRLHPFVVDGHRLLQFSFGLCRLLPAQETGFAGGRQVFKHQLLVILLFLLIVPAHVVETGVVAQFTIYIIISLVIRAEHRLVEVVSYADGIEDIQCLVVEADVRTADGQL